MNVVIGFLAILSVAQAYSDRELCDCIHFIEFDSEAENREQLRDCLEILDPGDNFREEIFNIFNFEGPGDKESQKEEYLKNCTDIIPKIRNSIVELSVETDRYSRDVNTLRYKAYTCLPALLYPCLNERKCIDG